MPKNNMTLTVGGEAGQGVETGGAGFAKALARGGLRVFGLTDYMSRIRGGYNFFQLRVSEDDVQSHNDITHLVLAFNAEAVMAHLDNLAEGGGVIYDEALKVDPSQIEQRGGRPFPMPLVKMAKEIGGSDIMVNTAALAATVGITEYDFERIADVIRQNFRRKGDQVVEANLNVARAAYDFARENYAKGFPWKLSPVEAPQRMLINGNHAFCVGAVASGCRFISGYPMTPATTILEWMTAHAEKFGIVTKQMEDEISACLMAIGASHAGARAMTATSGGGFCLMVEALGLAGCTETPLVIVLAQRGGPSTGLPTRTEQSDLEFVLHASHGEFPRIILSPGTIEQCFEAGSRAFNLAEKYQVPVIVMTDLFLATQVRAVDRDAFDFDSVTIDRGATILPEQLDLSANGYHRYEVTESGISPRAIPGSEKGVYVAVGDEHTIDGQITEDAEIRNEQMQKRMRKLDLIANEMRLPTLIGPANAEVTLVGWGSTYGSMVEAAKLLNDSGQSANVLHFTDVWPLPWDRVGDILKRCRRLVAVEQNYTGQLANILQTYTDVRIPLRINKYDGRPISPDEIVARLRKEVLASV